MPAHGGIERRRGRASPPACRGCTGRRSVAAGDGRRARSGLASPIDSRHRPSPMGGIAAEGASAPGADSSAASCPWMPAVTRRGPRAGELGVAPGDHRGDRGCRFSGATVDSGPKVEEEGVRGTVRDRPARSCRHRRTSARRSSRGGRSHVGSSAGRRSVAATAARRLVALVRSRCEEGHGLPIRRRRAEIPSMPWRPCRRASRC